MFIDFLHRFVIDHINCCYFRPMTYSIGENQSCEAKGSIRQSQPLVGQDDKTIAKFIVHIIYIKNRSILNIYI